MNSGYTLDLSSSKPTEETSGFASAPIKFQGLWRTLHMNEKATIQVRLEGLRPLMFDRYAGDNNTQLPVTEKMYLTDDQHLIIPSVNLYSLLCAENTKSVTRQFFGKSGKTIGLGIASYTAISPDDVPILSGNEPVVFQDFNEQIYIHRR